MNYPRFEIPVDTNTTLTGELYGEDAVEVSGVINGMAFEGWKFIRSRSRWQGDPTPAMCPPFLMWTTIRSAVEERLPSLVTPQMQRQRERAALERQAHALHIQLEYCRQQREEIETQHRQALGQIERRQQHLYEQIRRILSDLNAFE